MAEEKKRPAPRQEWKPNWFLVLLHRLWMILFGAAKIAIGAAVTVLLICIVCGLVFAGILGSYLEEDIIPFANYDLERNELEEVSTIYAVDRDTGEIQVYQKIHATISREWAELEEIPEDLIHAAVAIEDKRFYEHQGVDWFTTIKACLRMFVGDASAGGSSITQQLLKNATGEDSVTVQRKVREIFKAVNVEKKYDKDTIMEFYLNLIYLGQGCSGVKTAAETYFGKELQMLTTAECASLISITNNPSLYDPYGEAFEFMGELMTGMERNRYRQMLVLDQMLEQGWITQEEYDEAVAQEIVLKNGIDDEDRWTVCPNEDCDYEGILSSFNTDGEQYYCPECGTEISVDFNESDGMYSWFTDEVLEEVGRAMAAADGVVWNDETKKIYYKIIQTGGYSIIATVDPEVQAAIDNIYTDLSKIPTARSAQQLQSAIVVVDNMTGDIVGMAGKVGQKTAYDEWNIATDARLQSGSSIKPLTVYAPAFEIPGISPATVITDLPLDYTDGPYPLNDTRTYSYRSTIFNGIIRSINAVAANTLDMIGVGYSYNFAKNQFGLSTLVDAYQSGDTILSDEGIGPLALGAQTFGVTVRDMSCAFATFPNNGVYRQGRTFTKVYDRDGNLVLDNTQVTRKILSQQTANYINYCLNNAVESGTGYEARIPGVQVCGKTGTSGSNKDRWFCGYTGYYTAAVWCGFEWPETISITTSGVNNPAAYLWNQVMTQLHADKPSKEVVDTTGMRMATVCLESGKIATDACALDIRGIDRTQSALCYPEDMVTETCDKHVVVDYCVTGGGVATEYCKLFAEEGQAVIEKKALVKMTLEELEKLRQAAPYNLGSNYLRDEYIYLVDEEGNDAFFNGINDDLNQGVSAPYVVCTVHTKQAWEKYHPAQEPSEPEHDFFDWFNWPF